MYDIMVCLAIHEPKAIKVSYAKGQQTKVLKVVPAGKYEVEEACRSPARHALLVKAVVSTCEHVQLYFTIHAKIALTVKT